MRTALAFLELERADRRTLMSRKMEESSDTDTELWQVGTPSRTLAHGLATVALE